MPPFLAGRVPRCRVNGLGANARKLTIRADPPDNVGRARRRIVTPRDGDGGGDPPPQVPRRPSKDFVTSFTRRLGVEDKNDGNGSQAPADSAPTPSARRPSSDWRTVAVRRASRDLTREEVNVESERADAFGRLPRRRRSTDVLGKEEAPPIRGMRPRDELVYDEEKELAREYRRLVFDFDYWANFRATGRYFFHLWNIFSSRILKNILPPALLATFVAYMIAYPPEPVAAALTSISESGLARAFPMTLALDPLLLTSSTMSLLLVFRTNSSYKRFDEVRKMWGLMLNRTRDVVRMAISFFPEHATHQKANFARWTIVFTLALRCHLRPNENLQGLVSELLTADELKLLMTADHKVLLCLQVMSEQINKADISEAQRWQMMAELTEFEDILGGCERILRTPIPVAYTRHTARFMIIWINCLPLLTYAKLGGTVVPMTFLVSLLLMGIEEIGVEIEEPFGILPLEVIAAKAKSDIIELMNKQSPRRELANVKFVYDEGPFAG